MPSTTTVPFTTITMTTPPPVESTTLGVLTTETVAMTVSTGPPASLTFFLYVFTYTPFTLHFATALTGALTVIMPKTVSY